MPLSSEQGWREKGDLECRFPAFHPIFPPPLFNDNCRSTVDQAFELILNPYLRSMDPNPFRMLSPWIQVGRTFSSPSRRLLFSDDGEKELSPNSLTANPSDARFTAIVMPVIVFLGSGASECAPTDFDPTYQK